MKSSKSTIQKRQDKIMQMLEAFGSLDVASLASQLDVSEITIRRDLDQVVGKGLAERYYGGVRLLPDLRRSSQPEALTAEDEAVKDRIAEQAASLIVDRDVVFINSSSTAMRIIKYIQGRRAIIITNNAKVISLQHDPLVEIILTGGEVYGNKQSLIGEFALNTLSKIKATKCVIGVSGISIKGGITTDVLPETAINQMMLKRCSGSRIVITDGSKIGRERNFLSGTISDITHLITDKSADSAELDRLKARGLQITVIDESH